MIVAIVIAVVIVGGVVGGALWHERRVAAQATARAAARVRHLRSGRFPATCSWCKATALARTLHVYERRADGWLPVDVMRALRDAAAPEVEAIARALSDDAPDRRRVCSERCADELFGRDRGAGAPVLATCAYCGARAPITAARCPNCNAAATT